PIENVDLQDFETRRLSLTSTRDGRDYSLNMTSWETLQESIKRFVYDPSISQNENLTRDIREDRYRERLHLLIKDLRSNDAINPQLARTLTDNVNKNATVYQAIVRMTEDLLHSDLKFDRNIQQPSLSWNRAIQQIDQATNQMMFEAAVKHVREINLFEHHQQQVPGKQISFSPSVQAFL